jgi:hypothetical protein
MPLTSGAADITRTGDLTRRPRMAHSGAARYRRRELLQSQAGGETWPMREAGACQALAGEEKPPSEMRAERRGAAPQAMPRRPEPVMVNRRAWQSMHMYKQEGGGREEAERPGGSCRPTGAVQPKQREGRHPRCKSRREGEREVPGSSTADARRHVG